MEPKTYNRHMGSRAAKAATSLVLALTSAFVLALACDGPTSPESACFAATESECIASPECTLFLSGGTQPSYRCREAVGPCETGFVQLDGSADSCESKPGCGFEPANCYCAPGLVCVCGGGPPAQCTAQAG